MKKYRFTSVLIAAMIMATTFTLKASDFVSVIPVDIPERTIVQVTSPLKASASILIYDFEGTMLFSDRLSPEVSTRLFDFSQLPDGVYTFESNSDYISITKKIGIKDSRVEVLSKETEFKPVFAVDGDQLTVNFLNLDQSSVEFSIENENSVFYNETEGSEMHFGKKFDISKMVNGEYFARLKVDGKTFYHYFNVN